MFIAGSIVLGLEIILFLIWMGSLFSKNGTDPAGQGIAQLFVIGLLLYIGLGGYFLWLGKTWSLITMLLMGVVPMYFVAVGLWKEGFGRKKY